MANIDIFNTTKKYDVIYADPPWDYVRKGGKDHKGGMARQHYPTMKTEDICKIPVNAIKSEKAICFIWATFPNIEEALKVMRAWGFTYKTAGFVWVKKNKKNNSNFWGMGAYTRANAEVCLIGISEETKANLCVKDHGVHQIIESPIERHSAKPHEARKKNNSVIGRCPPHRIIYKKCV